MFCLSTSVAMFWLPLLVLWLGLPLGPWLHGAGSCGAIAKEVPGNLKQFYEQLRAAASCHNVLATGFWDEQTGSNTFTYCGDHLAGYSLMYIQGRQGALADMDVDCDGVAGGSADDGRCSARESPDLQNVTAFQDTLAGYGVAGVTDLDPYVHPYVVFGNQGAKANWPTFDPTAYGVRPLSVMAVVCRGGEDLVYGVWGDTNGDDGGYAMVGEASLALATACYGNEMSGADGYSADDVLYLAFIGPEAVPGAAGADWGAPDFHAFEQSIDALGDSLVARI
ncbi:fungal chitosanase of glycosyl hydrolase group 75-domain-containing protein, partial [Lasiosphaeria miniovina]